MANRPLSARGVEQRRQARLKSGATSEAVVVPLSKVLYRRLRRRMNAAGGKTRLRLELLARVLARIQLADELGRVGRAEYDARYAELDAERKTLADSKPRPVFLRQRDMLRTLVDDWRDMETRERRRLIEDVFAEVRANEAGVTEFLPRDDWRPYIRAVVPPELRVSTERKTGLEPATLTLAR